MYVTEPVLRLSDYADKFVNAGHIVGHRILGANVSLLCIVTHRCDGSTSLKELSHWTVASQRLTPEVDHILSRGSLSFEEHLIPACMFVRCSGRLFCCSQSCLLTADSLLDKFNAVDVVVDSGKFRNEFSRFCGRCRGYGDFRYGVAPLFGLVSYERVRKIRAKVFQCPAVALSDVYLGRVAVASCFGSEDLLEEIFSSESGIVTPEIEFQDAMLRDGFPRSIVVSDQEWSEAERADSFRMSMIDDQCF